MNGTAKPPGDALARPDDRARALAMHLLTVRRARRVLDRLPDAVAPANRSAGVLAQRAMAEAVGAYPPPGFKVGATARAMQDYLGVSAPVAGFMAADGLQGSGSTLRYDGFLKPGVECEIAVHLGRDLPPGCTPAQAADAVDGVMAGIEVVEQRYASIPEIGVPGLTADQMFHAAAVLGEPYEDWRSLDLEALPGRILVNGQERGSGHGRDLLGGPMQVLAWLAGSEEAAAFGGLRAGQVVMLGSVTTPIWLDGPCEVEVEFAPLAPVRLALV